MKNIPIDELIRFAESYFVRFNCSESCKTYFLISMEGHFHISAKNAESCFALCKEHGVISCRKGIVTRGKTIVNNNE